VTIGRTARGGAESEFTALRGRTRAEGQTKSAHAEVLEAEGIIKQGFAALVALRSRAGEVDLDGARRLLDEAAIVRAHEGIRRCRTHDARSAHLCSERMIQSIEFAYRLSVSR